MIVRRRIAWAAFAVVVSVSACGGGSSSPPTTLPSAPASLKLGAAGATAPVLVDGSGRTLYVNLKEKAEPDACNSSCLSVWPLLEACLCRCRPA